MSVFDNITAPEARRIKSFLISANLSEPEPFKIDLQGFESPKEYELTITGSLDDLDLIRRVLEGAFNSFDSVGGHSCGMNEYDEAVRILDLSRRLRRFTVASYSNNG